VKIAGSWPSSFGDLGDVGSGRDRKLRQELVGEDLGASDTNSNRDHVAGEKPDLSRSYARGGDCH